MGRYEVTQRGGKTCFVVHPAGAPFPIGCGAVCLILFLIVTIALFSTNLDPGPTFALIVLVMILPLLALLYLWKGTGGGGWRRETSFEVTPAGIEIGGGQIPAVRIHRLILRNHLGEGGGANFAVVNPGCAFFYARAFRNRVAQDSWRLEVDAQGQAYMLGGGLNETTAYGLMTDVQRAMSGEGVPAIGPGAGSAPADGFCTKCGAGLHAGDDFCTRCGARRG